MLHRFARAVMPIFVFAAATGAHAQLATTVSSNVGSGGYGGSLGLLNDGVYPANGTPYQTNTVYDYALTTYFDFTFSAGLSNVASFNLNVDNNDDYTVDFYNGATLVASRTVGAAQGIVGGGVETFCSEANCSGAAVSGTFLANLTLASPVQATFARISSAGGDGRYSIGEAQFFAAATSGVPEPTTWAMMMIGFGAIGAGLRRNVRRSGAAAGQLA